MIIWFYIALHHIKLKGAIIESKIESKPLIREFFFNQVFNLNTDYQIDAANSIGDRELPKFTVCHQSFSWNEIF